MNARAAWLTLLAAAILVGCSAKQDQTSLNNAPPPDTSMTAANPSETQELPPGEPEETKSQTSTTTKTKTKHSNSGGGGGSYTPPPAPRPSGPVMVDVTVPAGKSGGAALETALNSETSHVGDGFTATLSEDWVVDGVVVVPAGSKVMGHVSAVKTRARGKSKAMLTLSYDRIGLPGGKSIDIAAKTEEFEAGGDTQGDAARILGGTAGGAIIGGATGNTKRGAIIGGAAGVGAALLSKGKAMELEVGHRLTVTLSGDARVTVRKAVS